jgi:hypothetical protein
MRVEHGTVTECRAKADPCCPTGAGKTFGMCAFIACEFVESGRHEREEEKMNDHEPRRERAGCLWIVSFRWTDAILF